MNEMGGACSTHGGRGCTYRSLVGRPEGKNRLEDLGVNGKIILKWIFKKRNTMEGVDWIDLAQFQNR
jgi:hypothetical protein